MKVYVLTTGDYSDIRVRAAFVDRYRADEIADKVSGSIHELEIIYKDPPVIEYWERSGRVHTHWAPDPTKTPHFHTQSEGDPRCVYCTSAPKEVEYGHAVLVTWYPWDLAEVGIGEGPAKLGASVTKVGEGYNVYVRAETEERCNKVYHDKVAEAMAKLAGVA